MQTRRTFLARLFATAAVSTLPAPFIRASDKSGSLRPIVGEGSNTYECIHDWLVPPDGMIWGDTHGLCQDRQGLIYVGHTVHPSSMRPEAVVVFDPDGNFVRAFGEEFRGGAHGIEVRADDGTELLYHCDINRCKVVKTTLTGEVVWEHGYPREDPVYAAGPIKFVPTNVAFGPNGDFFVGDGYGSSRILKFSRRGEFLREIGGPGKADGQFDTPHGLWIDPRGPEPLLVVADRGNHRVQTFALDGQHRRTISDPQRLRMPCHFDVRGDVAVCPDLDGQVCLLDRDHAVIAQLGDGKASNGSLGSRRSQTRSQFTPGQFISPHDAIFLQNGDILVAEWLPIGRITLLRKIA